VKGPRICRNYLNEPDWREGYTCSLTVASHGPRHRAEGDAILEDNASTSDKGLKYKWVMEWWYLDTPANRTVTTGLKRIK
jgi:hypothetical protein